MTILKTSISETPVFSVAQLSNKLKKTVEDGFKSVRVQGEVSSLKRHTSGHIYFTLKDETAVINGICWRGIAGKSQFPLEDGLEVIITGRITIYEKRSNYQIIVDKFEPTGQGALLKLLEERKKKLASEGLFDQDRKLDIPKTPQTIGVITSPTGSVIRDIIHRIKDRFPCRIIVSPVAVQGEGASQQIATAIRDFDSSTLIKPDVIIVARGGGSLEDLWCFNEEDVIRAVAKCKTPLISAVGHETDTTLIDYAADKRAPTPTAAAEMAVPVLSDLWLWLQDRNQRISDIIQKYLYQQRIKLEGLIRGLPTPQHLIENKVLRLDDWLERLQGTINISLSTKKQSLDFIKVRLEQNSYQSTLNRGFVLAIQQGKIVKNTSSIKKSIPIDLQFANSTIPVLPTSTSSDNVAVPKAKTSKRKAKSNSSGQGSLF